MLILGVFIAPREGMVVSLRPPYHSFCPESSTRGCETRVEGSEGTR
jgi:hypothetical protein